MFRGALAFACAVSASAACAATTPNPSFDAGLYSQPAKLVEVARGRRLNLVCLGTGAPVVVLESGAGSFGASAWRSVQGEIAKFTRVCAYDRAGYGFSDRLIGEADAKSAVADLARLLKAGRLAQPVVLVGHSVGGLYAELFSSTYPKKVAGVVLVDPTGLNDFRIVKSILTDEERAEGRLSYPKMFERLNRCVDRARRGEPVGEPGTECSPPSTGAPALDIALRRQFSDPKRAEAVRSEMRNFNPPDADAVESVTTSQVRATPFKLGDKPLIVLRTGGRVPPGERGERLRALGAQETRRLVAASTTAKAVQVDSGHLIQDDHPDIVIAAVREVVDRVRASTR